MSMIPFPQLHVDKHLTNFAVGYKPMVGWSDNFLPIVKVDKQSDTYVVYSQADLWRNEAAEAGRGAEFNRINISVGSDTYLAKKYGLRRDFTIEDFANADNTISLKKEMSSVGLILDKLTLAQDLRVAAQITNTSNVGTVSNVASAWSDRTNSDPYGDINTQIDAVRYGTGWRPNCMTFGPKSFDLLIRNSTIIDKIKKTGVTGGDLDVQIEGIKALFRMDKVIVAEGFYNSADEGQLSVITPVFGDHVNISYQDSSADGERPTYISGFRWENSMLPKAMAVQRVPFNVGNGVSGIQAGYYQDEKIVSAPLSALISFTNCSQ